MDPHPRPTVGDPQLQRRAMAVPRDHTPPVAVTPGWGGTGQMCWLSCVQVSAELYWSIVSGSSRAAPWSSHPLPRAAGGCSATRDGEHLATVLILQGGVAGKDLTLVASTPPVPTGPQPRSGAMQAAALVFSTRLPSPACGCSPELPPCLRWESETVPWCGLPALCSLPALPVPNCGRGRQELQAVLHQQLPGGKIPATSPHQPWAVSKMHLECVETLAGAGRTGRGWQDGSAG